MEVLDRGDVGRLVPPALPPVEPEAPLRRLVLVAAVRDLAAVAAWFRRLTLTTNRR